MNACWRKKKQTAIARCQYRCQVRFKQEVKKKKRERETGNSLNWKLRRIVQIQADVYQPLASLLASHEFCFLTFTLCLHPSVSKDRGDSASPKFIVTLDGVPSPLGNFADSEMEPDDVRPPTKMTEVPAHLSREPKVSVLHRLQGRLAAEEGASSPSTAFK